MPTVLPNVQLFRPEKPNKPVAPNVFHWYESLKAQANAEFENPGWWNG